MKYFFLTEGWGVARVWGTEGLWNATAWRRNPEIERTNIAVCEESQILWLYRVEPSVMMVEVKPETPQSGNAETIGQVVLKRLMDAEAVLDRLNRDGANCQIGLDSRQRAIPNPPPSL